MANTTENPNEETIKCVVVGDNNVGKTKLICARAYKQKYPDPRCLNGSSHVPTVWAIDQYRINRDVLENARCNIDGTTVSLRLWDTFGDHLKNRKFAYGKADVVLICFSICDDKSLSNVERFWVPEVRKHCKNIPIILVACKADLRFADLVKLNKTKSCLSRAILHSDILYPDKSRSVALKLNCPYYETSVLLAYGVEELFVNACRAALIYRKTMSFWNSRLKKISRPALQKPLLPPMPAPPTKNSQDSFPDLLPKLEELHNNNLLTDVTFCDKKRKLSAHKVILAASSDLFLRLFSLNQEEIPFQMSHFTYCGKDNLGKPTYSFDFPFEVFHIILDFCYTGKITLTINRSKLSGDMKSHLVKASQVFDLIHLEKSINALNDDNLQRANELGEEFLIVRSLNLRRICVEQQQFADVIFQADDGCVSGHKVLLSSGCDMMCAMFAGHFIESENNEVMLPYTTSNCLKSVFEFLYLGVIGELNEDDICELIALANRLCLENLVSYLENRVIESFEQRDEVFKKTSDVGLIKTLCEEAVELLDVAQFHNARVLQQWCLHYLSVRYNEACKHAGKSIKKLPDNVQHYLEENRWPPVWFIKQLDHYERAVTNRIESENRKLKRY